MHLASNLPQRHSLISKTSPSIVTLSSLVLTVQNMIFVKQPTYTKLFQSFEKLGGTCIRQFFLFNAKLATTNNHRRVLSAISY